MTSDANRVEVAGVLVDALDEAAVHGWLRDQVATRPRPGSWLSTVNLDYLVNASRDAAFRAVLGRVDLAVADGAPVVWLSRLSGSPLPARVPGSDLTRWLVDGGAGDARIFLLGSSDETCRAVALRAERNGGRIAGWKAPPREVVDDPARSQEIVARINETGADVLLVAFGAPKQDLWLARHRDGLEVSVLIGVGGSLDLVAGRLRRAPRWVQSIGFEWAFRMLQEPGRLWRRYLVDDLPFLARHAARALRRRLAR